MSESESRPAESAPLSLAQTLFSTLAAFFGVQSSANRRRDFTHGKASHFIIMGLVATAGFIGLMILAVKLALATAQ